MSRLSGYADKTRAELFKHEGSIVENFMGGVSFKISPLDTLRMVSASSIFGEAQYYRDGAGSPATISKTVLSHSILEDFFISRDVKTAPEVFTSSIDAALDFDFKGTLEIAIDLRANFYMRLNPAVIFIRASLHPGRAEFNAANPGLMKEIGKKLILRPDDITNQFEYFMYLMKTKNKLPSIVKRTWSDRLSGFVSSRSPSSILG